MKGSKPSARNPAPQQEIAVEAEKMITAIIIVAVRLAVAFDIPWSKWDYQRRMMATAIMKTTT